MMASVKHRGGPYCGTHREILKSSRCMAWTARSVKRLPFPRGGLRAKTPQILCSRSPRGALWCLLRAFGRTALMSYVYIVQSCGEAFDECISQFSATLSYFDMFTVHFASASSTILVLYGLYAFAGRGATMAASQNIVLQVRPRFSPLFLVISHHHNQLIGILLAKTALSSPSQSNLAPSLILLLVVFTSACNVFFIDNVPFTPPFARIGTDGVVGLSSSCNEPTQ